MARLEELVNPSELLATIRTGLMKTEVLKKYKTSDQELAMMLLPLYRRGEMTKEEFNNFFQGIPIVGATPETAPVEAPLPENPVEEPPSEIRQALSKLFHRRSSTEPKPAAKEEVALPEEKTPSPPPEKQMQPAVAPAPVAQDIESPLDLELEEEEDELAIEEEPPKAVKLIQLTDSATLQDLVDTIFAKITTIENRVAALEKKVGTD